MSFKELRPHYATIIGDIPYVANPGALRRGHLATAKHVQTSFDKGHVRIFSAREMVIPPSMASYRFGVTAANAIQRDIRARNPSRYVEVEVGTGGGVISLAIANRLRNRGLWQPRGEQGNKQVELVATDLSADALAVADSNIRINSLHGIHLRKTNMIEGIREEFGAIDAIVCNPPFYPTGLDIRSSGFIPQIALDGGEDGLDFYRGLFPAAHEALSPMGWMLVRGMEEQMPDILDLACQHMPGRNTLFVSSSQNGRPSLAVGDDNLAELFHQ